MAGLDRESEALHEGSRDTTDEAHFDESNAHEAEAVAALGKAELDRIAWNLPRPPARRN